MPAWRAAYCCGISAARRKTEMDNRLYWLWLAGVLGFASPQAGTLLDLYGGAENLW